MEEVGGLMRGELRDAFNAQHGKIPQCGGTDIAEVFEVDGDGWHLFDHDLTGNWFAVNGQAIFCIFGHHNISVAPVGQCVVNDKIIGSATDRVCAF